MLFCNRFTFKISPIFTQPLLTVIQTFSSSSLLLTTYTNKPLSIGDQHYITINHQYINDAQWFLKIIYHLRADLLSWSERGKMVKNRIKKAWEIILNEIQASTGLRLDQCDSSGNSGTNTTGDQVREFFSYELRNSTIKAVPKARQNNFKRLIQLYSVILRVVSSIECVKIQKFRQLTTDFALFVAKEFNWIEYSMAVHSLVFHSAELVYRNNSVGLGKLSEEALESANKDISNFREFLSRKYGHLENITDVFNRLFIRCDPVINYIVQSSCGKRMSKKRVILTCPTEDDSLFEWMIVAAQ